MSLKRNSNDDDVIFVSKKVKIESTSFKDIPIELYQNIIFTDLLLLNTLLQVSKHIKNIIYHNRAFMIYHIMKLYNKKSRLLQVCFKNGYTEVIKLMYYKKNSKNVNNVNNNVIEIQNKRYLKSSLVNGRIGTCLLFKNHKTNIPLRSHSMSGDIFRSMYALNFKSLKTFYQNGYHLHESDFVSIYNVHRYGCHQFMKSLFFSKLKETDDIQSNWELYISITTDNLELFRWYTFLF